MENYEFVIVGAGVYGCAVAFELARSGHSVAVLERGAVASGSSGGDGERGVRVNGRDLRELPFARRAADLWPELESILGRPSGYRRTGGVKFGNGPLATHSEWYESLVFQAQTLRRFGLTSKVVDREGIEELVAGVAPGVRSGLYSEEEGSVAQRELTLAYAGAARSAGATIHEHSEVINMVPEGSGTRIVSADFSVLATKAAVILANLPGRPLLKKWFGLDLPIWRRTPQITFIEAPESFSADMLFSGVTGGVSMKTVADGRLQLSGGPMAMWSDLLGAGVPNMENSERSMRAAAALFPALSEARFLSTDASLHEGRAIDVIPIIDRIPGSSVHYGIGWSGHGFAIAPAMAESIASWLMTGERSPELAEFGAHRLAPRTAA